LSYPPTDAEAKTMRIADALRRQVEVLNSASDRAQEQLGKTGAALEDQANQIATVADQVASKVSVAREALAGETAALDDRIGSVGKALRGHVADLEIKLADAGRRLDDQANGFAAQVEAARRALGDPVEELAALCDKLAAQPAGFAKVAREQNAALIAAFEAAGQRFTFSIQGQTQIVNAAFDAAGQRFAEATQDQGAVLVNAAVRAAGELESRLRGKAEEMNGLFDRLAEQGLAAQDLVQSHLADLAKAAAEAEAMGASLRANLQDNVSVIRDSAAESSATAQGLGGMLEQRAAEIARTIEAQSRDLSEALTRHNDSLADLLRRQNEALLRDVAIGGGEAVRELRRETEDVAGALGEVHRQTEALRGSLQAQSHESTIIADRVAIE